MQLTKPIEPLKRPPLLYQSVQDAIRAYIIENDLQPGDPLPAETELSRKLGVSRNSVREAAKSLESLGVIETRRGSGLFVRSFSFDPILDNLEYGLLSDLQDLADITLIRRIIETGMIEMAMAKMSAENLAALREIVERMRLHAEQGETFLDDDREFHQTLFHHLKNKVLLKVLDIFWLTFHKAAKHADLWDNDPMWTYQAHAAILDALDTGDPERTRQALVAHYDGLERRLNKARQKRAKRDES